MADAQLKIVQSPTIQDVELQVPLHYNGLDQPILTNYVQSTSPATQQGIISPIVTLSGTTPTINCTGNTRIFEIVLTGNTTYSVINVATGQVFIVRVKQGTGTAYVNTWFATMTWITTSSAAPVQTATSNGITEYGFICRGAATFDGFLLGSQ